MQGISPKVGYLDLERASSETLAALRRTVLADRAAAPPCFLVRVDEFPHYLAWDAPRRYGTDRFRRFHEIMQAAGVPYSIAVPTRISHASLGPDGRSWRPLEEDEIAMLVRLRDDGVVWAPRTRSSHSLRLAPQSLRAVGARRREHRGAARRSARGARGVHQRARERLRAAVQPLRCRGVAGARQALHRDWRRSRSAPQIPAQAAVAGWCCSTCRDMRHCTAARVRSGRWSRVRSSSATGSGCQSSCTWGWEADADWGDLERLLDVVDPYAVHWDEFLAAVERSR